MGILYKKRMELWAASVALFLLRFFQDIDGIAALERICDHSNYRHSVLLGGIIYFRLISFWDSDRDNIMVFPFPFIDVCFLIEGHGDHSLYVITSSLAYKK